MRILKSMIIAFSMYSKLPMPQFTWKEEEMEYMLCFFPWVGGVIGVLIYFWKELCVRWEVGNLCYVLVSALIPLLLTGGFHVDGFMDTMDAFHSYQSRERKLEILKDSHIGAFAVIMLRCYGLCYLAAFSELRDSRVIGIACAGFFLSRCLSGISVVCFPTAKKEGMLYGFSDNANKRAVKIALYLQSLFCIAFMLWLSLPAGCLAVLASLGVFLYYYCKSKKELGGITGDTAGYFVLLCELGVLLVLALYGYIG